MVVLLLLWNAFSWDLLGTIFGNEWLEMWLELALFSWHSFLTTVSLIWVHGLRSGMEIDSRGQKFSLISSFFLLELSCKWFYLSLQIGKEIHISNQIIYYSSKVIAYLIFTFAPSESNLDVSSFKRLFEELTFEESVLELCEQLSLLVILEIAVTSSWIGVFKKELSKPCGVDNDAFPWFLLKRKRN